MTLLREPRVCNWLRDRAFAWAGRAVWTPLLALALCGYPALAQSPQKGNENIQGKLKPPQKTQLKGGAAAAPKGPSIAPPLKNAPAARAPSRPEQRVVFPPPDLSKQPPMLPVASREKMRACADQWSKLKMEQKEPLPLWRDFAYKCLTR
jgi:hypothetical protein